jgi:hypothetical protein
MENGPLNNGQDQLFTMSEMQRADAILMNVYKRASAPEQAFDWFDRRLKG